MHCLHCIQLVLLLGVLLVQLSATERKVYDFEDINGAPYDLDQDFTSSDSEIKVVSGNAKHGIKSLRWDWTGKSGVSPTIKFKLNGIGRRDIRKGGFKFWMRREAGLPDAKMTITVTGSKTKRGSISRPMSSTTKRGEPVPVSAVVNVNFTNYRGVWFKWEELNLNGYDSLDEMVFTIEKPLESKSNHIFLDLLRTEPSLFRQTRDWVCPPIHGKDLNGYEKHWQHSYSWSILEAIPPDIPKYNENQAIVLHELDLIESRLRNWYFSEARSSYRKANDEFDEFRALRYKTLMRSASKAENNYDKLQFNSEGSKIIGPSLFCKYSEFGSTSFQQGPDVALKFSVIMKDILLPMALSWYIRSRPIQMNDTADLECRRFEGDPANRERGLRAIAGGHTNTKAYLDDLIPKKVDCKTDGKDILKTALEKLNEYRLQKIMRVLEFVEVQGWDWGSSVGSLDHEMNKNGASYIHTLFLLKDHLKEENLLDKYLRIMKWYADFGEVYQEEDNYLFDGTTADRCRTILLYRVMIILMEKASLPAAEVIRDMFYFKQWMDHALKINKALGGIFKPDCTTFHHKTYYASAYTPSCLHNAALVQYLLSGTSFAPSTETQKNLLCAFEVYRITAVKYSTPIGVSGRFPKYNSAALAKMFPGYAYLAYKPKNVDGVLKPGVQGAEMFLRLNDPQSPPVKEYLSTGHITTPIYYLNSLGCLDILSEVKKLALEERLKAEPNPSIHSPFNYAGLTIHRRQAGWTVAVKATNNYVWDFELSDDENRYGLFFSHGSLQISNSEASLASYDVANGWDWTRLPGATTINLEFTKMEMPRGRWYNPKPFAGGASIKGSARADIPQNGIFGMEYTKPEYLSPDYDLLNTMDFSFSKSFFMMGELIVAVGSDITLGGAIDSKYHPQTTLFQDKLVVKTNGGQEPQNAFIKIGSDQFNLDTTLPDKTDWTGDDLRLTDTNGNMYRVPKPVAQNLHVKIGDQLSKTDSGMKNTTGRYAVAWLEHDESGSSFEYAILINGSSSDMFTKYTIPQKDNVAHVVSFTDLPSKESKSHGYVFFKANTAVSSGPVASVSTPCPVVTEEIGSDLYIALSNIAFRLVKDENRADSPACKEGGRRKREMRMGYDEDDTLSEGYDAYYDTDGGDDVNDEEGREYGRSFVEEVFLRKKNMLRLRNKVDRQSSEAHKKVFTRATGDDIYPFRNNNDVLEDYQYCRKSDVIDIVVTLRDVKVKTVKSVMINGKSEEEKEKYVSIENGGMSVRFSGLTDGFTTEAQFEI